MTRVNVFARVVIHFRPSQHGELCLVRTQTPHVSVTVHQGHVMSRHVRTAPTSPSLPSLVTNLFPLLLLLHLTVVAPPLYSPVNYRSLLRTATTITSHRMKWMENIPMPTGEN